MPGYQFVHIEAYSRSGGKGGRSVGYVLDEAERRPGATPHIESPEPPEVVHGMSIADLRALHDERCEAARQRVAGDRERAIRKDQQTLLTAVASYPVARADLDDAGRVDLAAWERRTVAWLREQHGDRLASVVRHADERFPHLHAYVLPDDPAMRASALHPGMRAKTDAMKGPAPADPDERKVRNREGDRAYREAMRGLQTSYWESVGLASGLARLGPGRRRLTREAWRAETVAAASVVEATRRQEEALKGAQSLAERGKAFTARTHAEAEKTRQRASLALLEANRDREDAAKTKAEAEGLKAEAIRRGKATIAKAKEDAGAVLAKAKAAAVKVREEAEAAARPLRTIGGAIGTVIGSVKATLNDDVKRHETELERVRNEERTVIESLSEGRKNAQAEAREERRKREAVEAVLKERSGALEVSRKDGLALSRRLEMTRHALDQATGKKLEAPTVKPPTPGLRR